MINIKNTQFGNTKGLMNLLNEELYRRKQNKNNKNQRHSSFSFKEICVKSIKMRTTRHMLNPQAPKKSQSSMAMQLLLQEFNKIDNRKQGSIKLSQAQKLIKQSIMKQYQLKKKDEITPISQVQINFDDISKRVIYNHENQVTFDEFLAMLYEAELDLEINDSGFNERIIQFLRLLEDYRKKCQDATEYLEAEKADHKIMEIKNKEMKRHKQKLLYQQKGKVTSINSLQQSKILQFNTAWNDYMQTYEDAAIKSIEKLKAKHLRQMQEEQQRIRSYFENYLKPSKRILDLKSKQKSLVKQREYQQAERVKQYANKLFAKERQVKTEQINQRIEKRKQTLKKHQEISLLAHLKRIQKDRNEQLKQRQGDSQKMLIKLRNIQNDLVQKQSIEIKQTLDNLRETMCLTSSQLFNGKHKMKSLGKLHHSRAQPQAEQAQAKYLIPDKGKPKEKTTFKIRVNSMHRVKLDHSLYDP